MKRLFIGTRADGSRFLELIVADTGCGVSREDKEKLFLPYFSTKGRGTGPGSRHREPDSGRPRRAPFAWKITCPPGARFIVEIFRRGSAPKRRPKRPEMPRRRSVHEARAYSDRRRRTADPPIAGRRPGRRRLSDAAVASGEDCCDELARAAYDLVLLDVWLPGMDGLETLARIQEIPFAEPSHGGDHFRARDHRNRGEGHQAGRIRFSGEAAHHRQSDGGGEERAAAAAARTGTGAPEGRRPPRARKSSAKAFR